MDGAGLSMREAAAGVKAYRIAPWLCRPGMSCRAAARGERPGDADDANFTRLKYI